MSARLGRYDDHLTETLNITRLGSGAYAYVYQHPTHDDIVVKAWHNDKWYSKYLDWVLDHQDNPYVPKIIDHVERGGLKFTFIEKLQPITKTMSRHLYVKWLTTVGCNDIYCDDNIDTGFVRYELAALTVHPDRDLAEVFQWILTNGYKHGAVDIDHRNVMRRGTVPVFTDPVGR